MRLFAIPQDNRKVTYTLKNEKNTEKLIAVIHCISKVSGHVQFIMRAKCKIIIIYFEKWPEVATVRFFVIYGMAIPPDFN